MRTILLCTAILTGCAQTPAVPEVVRVPVPVPCVKAEDVPAVPALTDEKALLGMDEYAATLTTWAERLELRSYAAKADALLQGCK